MKNVGKEIITNEQLARRLAMIATQIEKGCLVIKDTMVALPERATLKLAFEPATGNGSRVKLIIKWK